MNLEHDREKLVKFCNYIINMKAKSAMRKWKEVVWGSGGDPRYALLLIQERDRVRKEFF